MVFVVTEESRKRDQVRRRIEALQESRQLRDEIGILLVGLEELEHE